MTTPKHVKAPQPPDVTREEPFDFAGETALRAAMTDAELRVYGQRHAKGAAAHRLEQPAMARSVPA